VAGVLDEVKAMTSLDVMGQGEGRSPGVTVGEEPSIFNLIIGTQWAKSSSEGVKGRGFNDGYIVRKRAIVSGDVVEVYQYSKGYRVGYQKRSVVSYEPLEGEQAMLSREKSLKRARIELRRVIDANYLRGRSKFVTLTFADNVTDVGLANDEFKKFMKRLNYRVFGRKCSDLEYTVVVEFQQRGAVHYHVVVYNLSYIENKELANIWGEGFVKVNRIDDIDNVGAYVSAYLGKGVGEERLFGKKVYRSSRGINKPVQVINEEADELELRVWDSHKLIYKTTFDNEYVGWVDYKQYRGELGTSGGREG
jgi:hypothetical protein